MSLGGLHFGASVIPTPGVVWLLGVGGLVLMGTARRKRYEAKAALALGKLL